MLAVGLALILSACAHQTTKYVADPPGFWFGIWNGLTMVFAIVGHLMDDSIRIYAFPNSGGWYDFGYAIGVGSWGAISGAVGAAVRGR